jgi:hypothetical protein
MPLRGLSDAEERERRCPSLAWLRGLCTVQSVHSAEKGGGSLLQASRVEDSFSGSPESRPSVVSHSLHSAALAAVAQIPQRGGQARPAPPSGMLEQGIWQASRRHSTHARAHDGPEAFSWLKPPS